MDREEVIKLMTLSERGVFEKYKDIYPFPIKQFIEEIGIEIIDYEKDIWENDSNMKDIILLSMLNGTYKLMCSIKKKDNTFTIMISGVYLDDELLIKKPELAKMVSILLSHELMHYFYDKSLFNEKGDLSIQDHISYCGRTTNLRSWSFLMPKEIFKKQINELQSLEAVADYFYIPVNIAKDYDEYLFKK